MKRSILKQRNFFYLLFMVLNTSMFAQNFTWKKGTNILDIAGVYGTQGVASANNRPGSRDHAATWTDASGNFWLFGGNGYNGIGSFGYLNDLWKYNPATNEWTWMSGGTAVNQVGIYGNFGVFANGNIPGTRWGAASFIDSNGNLFLFGGYGYDINGSFGELNDVWVYSIALNQWKWIKGANICYQTANYGALGVPNIANAPGARYNATGWKDASGNFWIFGGLGYNGSANSYLNDLWRYTPANNEWTWIKGSNALNQTGTYGTQGTGAPANTPGSRCASAGWTDANGDLWLMAGYGYASSGPANLQNDMWKYHISTNLWTWYKGYNNTSIQQGTYGTQGAFAAPNVPGARYDAVTWVDGGGDLWLYGGYGFGTGNSPDYLNDLWRYDVGGNLWKWVKGAATTAQPGNYGTIGVGLPTNMPGSRGGSSTWKDGSNNLWLFGGLGYGSINNVGRLNDLWKFDNCIGPNISISSSSSTVCLGNSATLTASGANTYTWAGSQVVSNTIAATPLINTTLTAYGMDVNECRDTTTFAVSVVALPIIGASTNSSVICPFESVNLSATGGLTYTWSTGQQTPSISVVLLATLDYTVRGTDANGCVNLAVVTQSVASCLSLKNNFGTMANEVSAYPNPSNGAFTVSTGIDEEMSFVIFNAMGKIVYERVLDSANTLIKPALAKGIYYYQVENTSHETAKGKLIID